MMSDRKSRTLFVRNLPFSASNETLTEAFEEVGPIKTAFVVVDKDSRKCKGYGYVQFSMLEDAEKAVASVTHCGGRKIFSSFADAKKKKKDGPGKAQENGSQEHQHDDAIKEEPKPVEKLPRQAPKIPKQKPVKRCRLIVRNLAFKCKESQLKTHFEKFGEISEVTIPSKKGRSGGFGFVQFSQLQAAQKAVAGMNMQKIMGRPVAVDWAVAKDRFQTTAKDDSDKDSALSEEDEEKTVDQSESEYSQSESDEEEEDKEESDESGSEDYESDPEKKPEPVRKSDVDEGRTLFVRNVPFEAEEKELEEAFEEFGDLAYTRLVVVNGQPRGTAFVQYKSRESAEQCLAKAQGGERNEGIVIQGRPLLVTLAVSRAEAQNQKAAKKTKDQKDNRNLFLAREGFIRAGTLLALEVSQEDMQRRLKVEQVKREKLKNINIFVSSTRLCIHNLPATVDEKELKKVLLQTVDDSTSKITECRVMRNFDRTNAKGVSKSLGYAFVNFSTHKHALKAVRRLNNSSVFGDKKKPIVEFSLENKKALEAKERRLEMSKVNAAKRKATEMTEEKDKNSPAWKKPKKSNVKLDKTQDLIAKSIHKGPKGMPKRMGPKVRHRNRGKGDNQQQQQQQRKAKKQKFKPKQSKKQPRPKMKKQKAEVTDSTDKLIEKYKGKKLRK